MKIAYLIGALLSACAIAESTIEPASNALPSKCIESWMAKIQQGVDSVDYKNLGEKYCSCLNASSMSGNAKSCMSKTALHDAMDSLEEEVGLSDAKEDDVDDYCQEVWALIYPKATGTEETMIKSYCDCAKPKLFGLLKQADKMTDKQYDESIDEAAASCSDKLS